MYESRFLPDSLNALCIYIFHLLSLGNSASQILNVCSTPFRASSFRMLNNVAIYQNKWMFQATAAAAASAVCWGVYFISAIKSDFAVLIFCFPLSPKLTKLIVYTWHDEEEGSEKLKVTEDGDFSMSWFRMDWITCSYIAGTNGRKRRGLSSLKVPVGLLEDCI